MVCDLHICRKDDFDAVQVLQLLSIYIVLANCSPDFIGLWNKKQLRFQTLRLRGKDQWNAWCTECSEALIWYLQYTWQKQVYGAYCPTREWLGKHSLDWWWYLFFHLTPFMAVCHVGLWKIFQELSKAANVSNIHVPETSHLTLSSSHCQGWASIDWCVSVCHIIHCSLLSSLITFSKILGP